MDDRRAREEIRPQFQHSETGGKSGHGALTIRADEREGLHGWWQKTFSVTAGRHYRFSAWHRAENIIVPRRSVLARVLWRDDAENKGRVGSNEFIGFDDKGKRDSTGANGGNGE